VDTTSLSLLERLRGGAGPQDWERFVALYTPLLYRWARKVGAQEADAADLLQEVFTLVYRKLHTFARQRSGSFRAWMRTALVNRWRDLCRRRAARPGLVDEQQLDALPALDGPAQDNEDFEQLVAQALGLIRPEFQPHTWQAFSEFFIDGQEADSVAQRLGVSVSVVYSTKCRILRRLREELDGMLE
jgi:RNA polymerase sigma-70 factor (ECF subfamily)